MNDPFTELITALQIPLSVSDVLCDITQILEKQNSELSPSFISQSHPSILILERWAWEVFSGDSEEWIEESNYLQLFQTLALFNKNLIFNYDSIEGELKASLLIPVTNDWINQIFEHLENIHDENHLFISITSLWFDNLSSFLRENPEYEASIVISCMNRHIAQHYIMTDQYKSYLTELAQLPLSESIFTAKQLFYVKTCSLSLSSYLFAKAQGFLYTAEEIIRHLGIDYVQIVLQHTYAIDSWSPQLLSCITYLCVLFVSCCWWGDKSSTQTPMVFLAESTACEYIDALIRILSFEKLRQCATTKRSNDHTILLDTTLFSMINIAQKQDFTWFLRSKTSLPKILLTIAETSVCEKISLCIYGTLGEILTDERLKELKISDHASVFFFNMLKQAWQHPSQKFNQIPIYYLLKAFKSLSKIDVIQQKTADTNRLPLLIQMCDEYPMVFDILWALSFNHDIQQQLASNTAFMTKLAHLPKQCDNEQMRKAACGILWNLESNHEDRVETSDEKIFDIMISYSHKDQIICRRIYDELMKAGYRVWIDFDQMHGNVMDAMAQAIEQSKTILICMSEQYRRSNYCRAEAHYAFQRQLKIVPVLLQEHYQPDGWLLFLVGQLLYVDFNKYEHSLAMEMLIKELNAPIIREIGRTSVYLKEEVHSAVPVASTTPRFSSSPTFPKNILDWTEEHVHDWLVSHRLLHMSELLANSDGRSLMYMNEIIEKVELQQVVALLQDDALRRTNRSLSIVEFSQFRSLLEQQKQTSTLANTTKSTVINFEKLTKKCATRCPMM